MGLISRLKKKIKNKIQLTYYNNHSVYNIVCNPNSQKLEGKIALVTGGSGELGRAICFKLAAEGANVFIGGRTYSTVNTIKEEVLALGFNAEAVLVDVLREDSVIKCFDYIIDKYQNIDILVNCAGGSSREKNKKFFEQEVEVIKELLDVNLFGSMLCCKVASNIMVKNRSGKIINLSSVVALNGKENFSDYAAAKAGIIGLTKSLALELGKYGINVNCVSPGFIQRGKYNSNMLRYLKKSNCLGVVGKPEHVADSVVFLSTDASDFITGQNICVDGGRSLGLLGDFRAAD